MKIGVVSLFPGAFDYLLDSKKSGLVGELLKLNDNFFIEDLRYYGLGRHQVVDSSPYGGGDGMIFRPEPLEEAFVSLSKKMGVDLDQSHKIYFTPVGTTWTQKSVEALLSKHQKQPESFNLILLCGRYGGVDQRFIDQYINECISLGRFILNGGELPALSYLESILRVLPKTLGNQNSALNDSFSSGLEGALEPASYSRPSEWSDEKVPEVLVSGDHKRIKEFKLNLSKKLTLNWYENEIKTLKAELADVMNSIQK